MYILILEYYVEKLYNDLDNLDKQLYAEYSTLKQINFENHIILDGSETYIQNYEIFRFNLDRPGLYIISCMCSVVFSNYNDDYTEFTFLCGHPQSVIPKNTGGYASYISTSFSRLVLDNETLSVICSALYCTAEIDSICYSITYIPLSNMIINSNLSL